MSKFINLMGQQFGRLTIIQCDKRSKSGNYKWLCKCSCGKDTIVSNNNLKNGHTKSCGCLNADLLRTRATKHGHCKKGKVSRTYYCWHSMIKRCTKPNNKAYKNYGGRGIKVCNKWMKFENFLKNMGECPKGMSLDRINNNGNYCKSNCRWTTYNKQNRNKRNNINITFKNKTQCLTDWAKELNCNKYTVIQKLFKLNEKSDKALNIIIK